MKIETYHGDLPSPETNPFCACLFRLSDARPLEVSQGPILSLAKILLRIACNLKWGPTRWCTSAQTIRSPALRSPQILSGDFPGDRIQSLHRRAGRAFRGI